jgi:hypothetical protein
MKNIHLEINRNLDRCWGKNIYFGNPIDID